MSDNQTEADHTRRRRLLYRATHRGSHECDLLIGGFVARRIATLDAAALDALETLMDLPDSDLADWLTGRLPIPPEADSAMLRQMRAAAAAGENWPGESRA
jgi:antitoxin CptB